MLTKELLKFILVFLYSQQKWIGIDSRKEQEFFQALFCNVCIYDELLFYNKLKKGKCYSVIHTILTSLLDKHDI